MDTKIDYGSTSIKQGKFELCGNTVIGDSEKYPSRKVDVSCSNGSVDSWIVHSTGLNICEWNYETDKPHKWVIASFEYYKSELCYQLISCCDRLKGIKDWNDFGILVEKAYEILDAESESEEGDIDE